MNFTTKQIWTIVVLFFIAVFGLTALFSCQTVANVVNPNNPNNASYQSCTKGMSGYGAKVKKTKTKLRF